MSDHENTDLGIQAFRDMSAAMDRLGVTLQAVDRRQQLRLNDEAAEASGARLAATEAGDAARVALQAAKTGLQAAKTEIRSSLAWTALTAVLGAFLTFGGGYWAGRAAGWDLGQAIGYASARSEIAAASWANTLNGRRALFLDESGGLATIMGCTGQNWHTETQNGRRVCFPGPIGQPNLVGWFVP